MKKVTQSQFHILKSKEFWNDRFLLRHPIHAHKPVLRTIAELVPQFIGKERLRDEPKECQRRRQIAAKF